MKKSVKIYLILAILAILAIVLISKVCLKERYDLFGDLLGQAVTNAQLTIGQVVGQVVGASPVESVQVASAAIDTNVTCRDDSDCAPDKKCGKQFSTVPGANLCYVPTNPLAKTRWVYSGSTNAEREFPWEVVKVFDVTGTRMYSLDQYGRTLTRNGTNPILPSSVVSFEPGQNMNSYSLSGTIGGETFNVNFSQSVEQLKIGNRFYNMVPFYAPFPEAPPNIRKNTWDCERDTNERIKVEGIIKERTDCEQTKGTLSGCDTLLTAALGRELNSCYENVGNDIFVKLYFPPSNKE